MISKEEFVKFLGYIKKTQKKEDKIDTFVRELSFDGYCYMLSDEISYMIEMLCAAMGIEYNSDDICGDDIQYFIYDLEWGTNWKPGCITEDDKDIDISTPEKLYDYLVSEISK